MKRAILEKLQQVRAAKRPAALVTHLTDGRQWLLVEAQGSGELSLTPAQQAAAAEALTADRSGPLADHPDLFVHVYNPPLRLLVVGAVHISQALVPMAQIAGYEVIVIDPRKAWANEERFPCGKPSSRATTRSTSSACSCSMKLTSSGSRSTCSTRPSSGLKSWCRCDASAR
jgi:xanthine dehydrogenase accessory factor